MWIDVELTITLIEIVCTITTINNGGVVFSVIFNPKYIYVISGEEKPPTYFAVFLLVECCVSPVAYTLKSLIVILC